MDSIQYRKEVLEPSLKTPQIVVFTGPSCVPCENVKRLASTRKDVSTHFIDITGFTDVELVNQVVSVPTTFLIKDGQQVFKGSGVQGYIQACKLATGK